jgi:hypothetical protein
VNSWFGWFAWFSLSAFWMDESELYRMLYHSSFFPIQKYLRIDWMATTAGSTSVPDEHEYMAEKHVNCLDDQKAGSKMHR